MLSYEFIDPEKQISSAEFKFVESFLKATGRTQLGWHYITDIAWIYSKIKSWPRNYKILDAGGGRGPLQFLLAELGFQVINIDMLLAEPRYAYAQRYQTTFNSLPSFTPTSYIEMFADDLNSSIVSKLKWLIKSTPVHQLWSSRKYNYFHNKWRSSAGIVDISVGTIQWITGNLCEMPEIMSESFDAVVSLSAWEHIPYEILEDALSEINRVLKPDAKWAVTTSATEKSKTWWHEPSKSNCFSAIDLERLFIANSSDSQNPEKVLDKYRSCTFLKENLADFYKKSGNYGMPWGIWNPTYIPVGLSN